MLYLFCLSSVFVSFSEQNSIQNSNINSDSTPIYFAKINKKKEQILVLYPSGSYSFFCNNINKNLFLDSGTYKKNYLVNRIHFESFMPKKNSNPFIKENSKIYSNQIVLIKSNYSFKKVNEEIAFNTIRLFKDNSLSIEIAKKSSISKNSKYSVQSIEYNAQFISRIKKPDSTFYYYGQKLADSLYKIEKAYSPVSNNIKIRNLTREIIKNETSDSAKVLKICQWIVSNFDYELSGSVDPNELIETKKTRCEGYANFFLELCKSAKIPCIKVVGVADNESTPRYETSEIGMAHAWNMVKINGKWQHIDVTWLDPIWPKGYNGVNLVTGKEYYFNPIPEKFVFEHLPEINGLKMTNLGARTEHEFYNSPIQNQFGYDVQFIGEQSNRISGNNDLEFYFYCSKPQNLYCRIGYNNQSFNIELNTGINKISLTPPSKSCEVSFSNANIKVVFFVIPEESKSEVLNQALQKAEKLQYAYNADFYSQMNKLKTASTLNFHPDLLENEKNIAVWKTILKKYNGRNPVASWYVSYNDSVRMRFYIPDLTMNNKEIFLECKVDCRKDQISCLDPIHYPTSDWRLGLK